MTKQEVKKILIETLGCPVLMNMSGIARKLNVSPATVGYAHARGSLRACDRWTFEIDDVADWLSKEPRYLVGALGNKKRYTRKQTEETTNEQ